MQIIKLSFIEPVHFGSGRLASGTYTCDSAALFSALYIEAIRLGTQANLLNAANNGEFELSDAFPCINDTYYVPKPLSSQKEASASKDETASSRMRKASKKLSYIPINELNNFLAGNFDPIDALQNFNLGVSFVRTAVNLKRENSNDARPFQVGGYSFFENAGLYFIVNGCYDISPLLDQLCYSGLGGKRSSGYGRFTYSIIEPKEISEIFAKIKSGQTDIKDTSMLLNSALPQKHELTDDLLLNARYRLIKKSGFIQSTTHSVTPQKKHDMYLFAAGSLFNKQFSGAVFDVNTSQDAHPVYRYAKAMWIEV